MGIFCCWRCRMALEWRSFWWRTSETIDCILTSIDTLDVLAWTDVPSHTDGCSLVTVVSDWLSVAGRDWEFVADFVWLECMAERCVRKLNSATYWGFYARNTGNNQRWNSVGMEIPLVITVHLSLIQKSVAFFFSGRRPVNKSLHPWIFEHRQTFEGVFWRYIIQGKINSPHSGHWSPGRNAPGMYPQLRQIELVKSSIISLNPLN